MGASTNQDMHGTETSGIVAASGNNNMGITGVAYNCKVIPVRVGWDAEGAWAVSDEATGIEWAADPTKGAADVLTNSWRNPSGSSVVDYAITRAVTIGRNGLGCVVVFAAGNEGKPAVDPPAINPQVLSVGGCDEYGGLAGTYNLASHTLYQPYSNYDNGLDVVAPSGGNNALNTISYNGTIIEGNIYTTVPPHSPLDNLGGGYTSYFSGTSAACPLAAGVAALVLSVNKCLSYQSVINIIESTCTKQTTSSNPVEYTSGFGDSWCYTNNFVNGTWSEFFGYGRINAGDAVTAAYTSEPYVFNTVSYTNTGSPVSVSEVLIQNNISQCPLTLASNLYFTNRIEVDADITYPYTINPVLSPSSISNGWSAANPNGQVPWCGIKNITNTSATLYTFLYGPIDGSYFPVGDPSYVRFSYSIVSAIPSTDFYFQNQTVNNGQDYSAVDNVYSGYSVDLSSTLGNVVVQNGSDLGFHAGNTIFLEPGFNAQSGSEFLAAIGPAFYPCAAYPNPDRMITSSGADSGISQYDRYITNQQLKKSSISNDRDSGQAVINYPNPFNDYTNLQITLLNDENNVSIRILDMLGREIVVLNNDNLKRGINYVRINGQSLNSGCYFYKIATSRGEMVGKMCKLE
jgi:hypothetical protein